jgi:hypothetical protein
MNTEQMIFEFIYRDIVTISPGVFESISFFQDEASVSVERITDEHEQQIVRWIFDDDMLRQKFLSKVSCCPGRFRYSIPDMEFDKSKAQKGGDIDLVVLEQDNPSQGICIEFKKVKVRVDSSGKEWINGLRGLEKLIDQGNARQLQGFWKNYICAIAIFDSHHFETPNVFLRRGDEEDIAKFYGLANIPERNSDVGIILVELHQPTGKSFRSMFGFGVCKVREAAVLEQPSRLTEDIQTVFRESGGGQA